MGLVDVGWARARIARTEWGRGRPVGNGGDFAVLNAGLRAWWNCAIAARRAVFTKLVSCYDDDVRRTHITNLFSTPQLPIRFFRSFIHPALCSSFGLMGNWEPRDPSFEVRNAYPALTLKTRDNLWFSRHVRTNNAGNQAVYASNHRDSGTGKVRSVSLDTGDRRGRGIRCMGKSKANHPRSPPPPRYHPPGNQAGPTSFHLSSGSPPIRRCIKPLSPLAKTALSAFIHLTFSAPCLPQRQQPNPLQPAPSLTKVRYTPVVAPRGPRERYVWCGVIAHI
jgi:hypothetical protein